MKILRSTFGLLLLLLVTSCGSGKLVTTAVSYQSVRTVQYKDKVPSNAKIAVGYSITPGGQLVAIVENRTDEIMIIDQIKSFFVNTDGKSTSYYDPTVRTTTNTSYGSNTTGATVNLGAIAGALGIGGPIGSLLGGVNVGESNTLGSSTTNTTYFADQPQISLAPKSHGAMSKNFSISGVGTKYDTETYSTFTSDNSYLKFSVCISYSVDGGNSFDKIVTPFYVNSLMVCPVKRHGKVNEALRTILQHKPDAIHEQWWVLKSVNTMDNKNDNVWEGSFLDWK